ncbi:MAG: glycosyltransferase family 2 protein [Acutalibacteraceae bacterium]|nr:glycosyltransferase family 2 protein [Acutalibacteraceae bacterium]
MPLISVIVPVYKVEPYLSRCINSILTQSYTDFELILIDDGSPDNCGKICDEYAQKDNRIQVIHKENGGLSSARNAGIDWVFANSNSQWLTFIDSDDWIHPQYLELLLSGANSTNTDICVCEYTETSEFSDFENLNKVNAQKLSTEDFFVNHHVTAIIACCKIYKKNCFENIRYPVGKLHEDEYTTYKILFEKNYISYLKDPLYFYYTNPDSIVRSEWSPKRLDAITAYEEQIAYFRKNGYKKALVKVERKLLWYIIAQVELTEKSDEYAYLTPKFKKDLRIYLKIFKADANLSINNGYDFYIKAYPTITKLYCIVLAILKKLKILRR